MDRLYRRVRMRMEERQEEQQEIRRGRKSGVQAIIIFHGITFLDFLGAAREPRPVFISSSGFLDKKGKRKMNTIKRDVYVLRNTIKIPIEVTKGTDMLGLEFAVRDYEIPATAAAVAYVYHKSMDKPKGTLCDVDNSVISFTPSGDFFAVGMNELQIRVINDGKSLISFKETIKCSDTMGFPDDEEEKQKTLVEQLLTKVGKEEGDRKTADDTEREERIAADDAEKKARIAEENARAEADEAIRANRIVTLDEIDLVTEEGFFVDALAVKELNSNLTKTNTVLENRKPIFIDSTAQGTANLDTNSFLKAGVTYAFIVIVSSNISSESYKQEIACALNNVNMGNNGNYYKLVSTFTGKCSKGDKLHITSYKNGGTWTLFATRAIFIPVS
nr:MAG TPA: Baseplate component [Caudoviricetes sp.]